MTARTGMDYLQERASNRVLDNLVRAIARNEKGEDTPWGRDRIFEYVCSRWPEIALRKAHELVDAAVARRKKTGVV